jgi:hypothetical protein
MNLMKSYPFGKAWRNAVQNAKSQVIHQENHIMNLQVSEERVSGLWLQQNAALEKYVQFYKSKADETVKNVRECHKARQKSQDLAQPELLRLTMKRDQSLMRRLNCEAAVIQLLNDLKARGFNYDEHVSARMEEERQKADPNNAAYNSTVREYETVHVSTVEGDDDDDAIEVETKKRRIDE